MALFGFNKQKVLANAEKYVQQGKLQNAISEYEKILKHDNKDLTVTNTVGDLYSRSGDSDKATECFKSVGDAYASQGFTVKAIAMYKKICKLQPSLESLLNRKFAPVPARSLAEEFHLYDEGGERKLMIAFLRYDDTFARIDGA